MGGLVKVLVREENGKITSGLMGTSTMNYMVKKSLLIPNGYLNNWTNDFIKETLNNSNEWLVNESYVTKEELSLKSPYEYGIVVIDFKKKKLNSYQGYSNPKWIRIHELFEMMENDGEKIIPIFNLSLRESVIKRIKMLNKKNEVNISNDIVFDNYISKSINELDVEFKCPENFLDYLEPELKTTIIIDNRKVEVKETFFDLSHFDGTDFYNFILALHYKSKNDDKIKEAQKYFKEKNINIDFDLFDYVDSYIDFESIFNIKCRDSPNRELKEELESDGFIFSKEENNIWKNIFSKNKNKL